eukprot:2239594-Prymnesium_polylepis.1
MRYSRSGGRTRVVRSASRAVGYRRPVLLPHLWAQACRALAQCVGGARWVSTRRALLLWQRGGRF